ncbi:MAG: cold shock domain-containing protein [Shimia sp.]
MSDQSPTEVSGTVKWYDVAKGFGFILPDNPGLGGDVLLHANTLRDAGLSSITAGTQITVQAISGARGWQAVEVTEVASQVPVDIRRDPSENEELRPARLKWFDHHKGYGFLNLFERTEDVFVHIDVLRLGGIEAPIVGEALSVVIADGAKGLSAVAVYSWDSATRRLS